MRLNPAALALAGGVLGGALCCSPASAQDLANFQVYRTGFALPTYLGSPPGEPERILVGEIAGVIRVIENGVLLPTPFLDIRSRTRLAHGLIGVAFPPDYATSRRFYINYTPASITGPRISRFTTSANPNVANTTEEPLLDTGAGNGDHNSGWMGFGRDGLLYIARGDAGGAGATPSQDPGQLQGKLLRIDVSGASGYTSPPGNPFAGGGGRPEIVAMGLRNPWRDGIDALTGDIYIADVGQGTQEEIDYIPFGTVAGRNFGWPCVEGTVCWNAQAPCSCSPLSMTAPVLSYPRDQGWTVIGGTVYRGDAIPRWRGRYFFLDWGSDRIWSMAVVNGVATDVRFHPLELNQGLPPGQPMQGGISFGVDGAGEMYVLEQGGRILKIVPQFARADWDLDGTVTSSDFYDYLIDFLSGRGDVNGDHITNSQDVFDFLGMFFNG